MRIAESVASNLTNNALRFTYFEELWRKIVYFYD